MLDVKIEGGTSSTGRDRRGGTDVGIRDEVIVAVGDLSASRRAHANGPASRDARLSTCTPFGLVALGQSRAESKIVRA